MMIVMIAGFKSWRFTGIEDHGCRRFAALGLLLLMLPFVSACTGLPKGVTPVGDFELDRYVGDWYEIARLDHRFERDLQAVTAQYSLNDDGTVTVVNSGFSTEAGELKRVEGKAKFVGDPDTGHLKVSFFGPYLRQLCHIRA
jgi:apolipoprotein D and lipocalin family protein